MRIGIVVPNYARWWRGEAIWDTCAKAREAGVDSLHFVDHIIFTPAQYIGYGNGYMDMWTTMSYVAAITNIQGWRPTLAQSVCVIPYRPPIQQAKIAATVDSLSGGRLQIGAGTGYNEQEFAALGLNVHERGDMTDEYLKCMIELWTHPVASFHGKYANFDEMTVSVRPIQQPIPILVGATGKRPFRRVAEFCHGWIPGPGQGADGLKRIEDGWTEINTLWKEYGRQGEPYLAVSSKRAHLVTDWSQAGEAVAKGVVMEGERAYVAAYPMTHVNDLVKEIRSYESIGAKEYVVFSPTYRYGEWDNNGTLMNQLELLGEHVIPKVR
ncbi:MAG: TIGR03619 family F420-dependent LLM class oxidoreductase [Chloroflexota bacterium]